jgi:hypothetical protein
MAFKNTPALTSVTFKDPDGWIHSYGSSPTSSGKALTLTDPSENVQHLRNTNDNSKYWHKK